MSENYDLLDIKQAAKYLNVSETSLRRWTNSGKLTCLRLGNKRERRFRRTDLNAFLENEPTKKSIPTTDKSVQHTLIGGVPVAYGSHYCSLYSSNLGRTKLAVGFLLDGLHQGCACHLISTPQATHEILNQLKLCHPNFQVDIDKGKLIISEYLINISHQLEQLEANFNHYLRQGAKAIRLVGNISDGQLCKGKPIKEAIKYEEDYERFLSQRFPLVTLCQYDVHQHSGHDIQSILKCHQNIFQYPSERLLF